MLDNITRYWWLMLLRGAAAIIFGFLAWSWPGLTLLVLLMFFAAYALIEGISALALGLSGREGHRVWWQMILVGLLGIAAAVITIFWPQLTAVVLLTAIGIWAILRGVFEIGAAVRLRRVIKGEWMLILSGVLSVLFGILLLSRPGAGILALVWLIGAFAVTLGALEVALSFRLRHLKHHPPGGMQATMGGF